MRVRGKEECMYLEDREVWMVNYSDIFCIRNK